MDRAKTVDLELNAGEAGAAVAGSADRGGPRAHAELLKRVNVDHCIGIVVIGYVQLPRDADGGS